MVLQAAKHPAMSQKSLEHAVIGSKGKLHAFHMPIKLLRGRCMLEVQCWCMLPNKSLVILR